MILVLEPEPVTILEVVHLDPDDAGERRTDCGSRKRVLRQPGGKEVNIFDGSVLLLLCMMQDVCKRKDRRWRARSKKISLTQTGMKKVNFGILDTDGDKESGSRSLSLFRSKQVVITKHHHEAISSQMTGIKADS